MSASDILDYFNKNIFPKIKNKYFSFPVRTKRAISELFSKQKEMNLFYRHEGSINKRFWAEVARWIFELVVGNNTHDIKRVNLFLEVMYLKMTTNTKTTQKIKEYCVHSYWDFAYCAKLYNNEWEIKKSNIIQEALRLCDQKFWKWVTSIGFNENDVIFANEKDFVKHEE